MTDEELVRRMQRGDMQAFDELYARYKNDAYRVACLITGNRADGEDLTQEAFVICARSIGSLKDGAKFRPWLLKTLSRAAWKYCRKTKRETPVAEFFEPERRKARCPPYSAPTSSGGCMKRCMRWMKSGAS